MGDACDPDDDNDGVPDGTDNCPKTANAGQFDNDGDEVGDACDADADNDGICDRGKSAPTCTGSDNCRDDPNPDQTDTDGLGVGDACDNDDDQDGKADAQDACPRGNLDWTSNATTDHDNDGCRDAGEDTDDDNDGVPDTSDNCDFSANPGQADSDNDGVGDACDTGTSDSGTPGAIENRVPLRLSISVQQH